MPPFQFRLPQLQELTLPQRKALNETNPIILSGVPGCGKTVVSIYRMLLSDNAELFTYTNMLKAGIAHSAIQHNQEAANRVHSIYKWFWDNCRCMLGELIENQTILEALQANNKYFAEVIFDEGQDLPIVLYEAFREVSDRVSVGIDDAQQIYPEKGISESELRQIFRESLPHSLGINFRNSFEIFNFAKEFVPFNQRVHDRNLLDRLKLERSTNEKPYLYILKSKDGQMNILHRIVEAYRNGNIGVLLEHKKQVDDYYDYLAQNGFECSKYHSQLSKYEKREAENDLKNIFITTYHSAKGLEFDTVIFPEFHDASENNDKLYYVGATRARSHLFILCVGDLPEIIKNDNFDRKTFEIVN